MLDQQRFADLRISIEDFKAQVDVSVNSFLLQDKEKITATLESATSSAASPELLRRLLEKTVSDNLAGNQGFMRHVVAASLRNGIPIDDLRFCVQRLWLPWLTLVQNQQKASRRRLAPEAVKKIVNFATGTGMTSIEIQKELLVALMGVEAVSKNRNVLSTARVWQSVFNTRVEVVQGTIAALIGSETGAAEEDSASVAAATFSRDAFGAGGLLLSGYASQGPLSTLFATAQSDARIDVGLRTWLRTQFDGEKLLPKGHSKGSAGGLNVLLDKVNNIHKGLSEQDRNAKKNVEKSTAAVQARNIAGAAAQKASQKGAAAARKAYSGSGKY